MDALEHLHYDGMDFLRELVKFNDNVQGKATMPIVFTSMIISSDIEASDYEIGKIREAVSQTSQVYLEDVYKRQVMGLCKCYI